MLQRFASSRAPPSAFAGCVCYTPPHFRGTCRAGAQRRTAELHGGSSRRNSRVATRRSHVLFSHWPIRNKLQLGLGLLGSLGAHAVRQRVLRPVRLPRAGEKPQRPLGRAAAGRTSCAITSPTCTKSSTRCKTGSSSTKCFATHFGERAEPTRVGCRRLAATRIPHAARPVLPDARTATGSSSIPIGCAPKSAIGDDQLRARNAGRDRRRAGAHPAARRRRRPGLAVSTTKRRSASCARMSKRFASWRPSCPAICTSGSANWRPTFATQYRWAIGLAWVTAALATMLLVAAVQLFRKWIARPLATLVRRLARSGRRQVRPSHSPRFRRRDARAGRGDERHDGPLSGNSRRPRLPGPRADEAGRSQRATGERRLSGRRRGPRNQQSAGVDRHVQRVARRPA